MLIRKENSMKNIKNLSRFAIVATQFILMTSNAQINADTVKGLNAQQQSLAAIAALAGKGDLVPLQAAFNDGLNAGWTINELKEAMVHLYAYAGFPRSLNGLNILWAVVNARKQKGIKDVLGKEPSPVPADKSKLEAGTALQAKLLGRSMKVSIADFAPIIDVFLKEHLFWDIFARDNLNFKTRELITISTLAGLGNAENQLRSHIGVSMYNGITEPQLQNWVSVIQTKVGSKEGKAASQALFTVLHPGHNDTSATSAIDITTDNTKPEAGIKKAPENIFPKGEKITNSNFTGDVWLQNLVDNDSLNDTRVGSVTFEPGARTKWHYHPDGQILLAIGGTGFYQEKGSAKKILHKGDVVKCPPDVPHWHGASNDDEFVQVAISGSRKGATVWLQAVTGEEYNSDK